jgi:uncharacterized membrane protein YqhA
MINKLLRLRFIYMIAVVVTFINSLVFLYLGVRAAYHGLHKILENDFEGFPGLLFLESLDMFMVALVFLIFSLGVMRIFTHYDVNNDSLPAWLRISSFKELKVLLWETILMTLAIASVSSFARRQNALTWDVMIIPAMVLVLSLGLYLMRKEDNEKHGS